MTPQAKTTHLRIIWAIVHKDMLDAFKNKTILSILFSVLFVVVAYYLLPSLEDGERLPRLALYDAGDSPVVTQLEGSDAFDLVALPSLAALEDYLGDQDHPTLGLTLPADLDQALVSDQALHLDGYVIHWLTPDAVAETRTFFETQLTALVGQPVRIDLAGHTLYTDADSTGRVFLATAGMVITMTMVGLFVTPHLMLEEKETRTMDALLVSPANTYHVIAGKALAGLCYCLLAIAAPLALNHALITHWGLALLVALSGTLVTVGLGLLIGSLASVKQQIALWTSILVQILLFPVFLSLMDDLLPQGLIAALRWIPTVAMSRALRWSFSQHVPAGPLGLELARILGSAALVLAMLAWHLRRSEQ